MTKNSKFFPSVIWTKGACLLLMTVVLASCGGGGGGTGTGNLAPPPAVATAGKWLYVGGDTTGNTVGVYSGTALSPGGRRGATGWVDAESLWIFGGFAQEGKSFVPVGGAPQNARTGRLSDLWKFSFQTRQWTLILGDGVFDRPGAYSGQMVSPGARDRAVGWTDKTGRLWLFGGSGVDAYGNRGELGDLWMFDPASLAWSHIGGAMTANTAGTYSPASMARPGARSQAVGWTDLDGSFWMYGGQGFDAGGVYTNLADLWKFSPSDRSWVFRGGSTTEPNTRSDHFGASPKPGARMGSVGWVDVSGKLWLYGGTAFDAAGVGSTLDDLWRFDPDLNQWSFVGGHTVFRDYGWPSVYSGGTLWPGTREAPASAVSADGTFWMFGERVGPIDASTGASLSAIWSFDVATGKWQYRATSLRAAGGTTAGNNQAPVARTHSILLADRQGRLWLFGGDTLDGMLGDLWMYTP